MNTKKYDENKYIQCFETFKLNRIHYRQKADDDYKLGFLTDSDMVKLNHIYDLVEQGRLFDARNIIITIDHSLKPYIPELPKTKVKGVVEVDFEIETDLSIDETKKYIKNIIEIDLSNEGQTYRHFPNMDSIKFSDDV